MAEQTLLQIVQTVLSALDSDEINSISDTIEATKVARVVQNKYYDILTRGGLPEMKQLFQLNPSLDTTKPTQMSVPAGVSDIDWIKYFDVNPNDSQQQDQFGSFSHGLNLDLVAGTTSGLISTPSTSTNTIGLGSKTFTILSGLNFLVGETVTAANDSTHFMAGVVTSYVGTTLIINVTAITGAGTFSVWTITNTSATVVPGYKYVTILPIEQFLDMVNRFNPGENNVFSYQFTEGGESFLFYYKNDIQPRYCTVIQNTWVLFDSFNINFESTLQASNTLVYGQIVPPFSLTDTFVPPIDDNQFPLLINEAKALAFYELKQTPHLKADQEINRQWSAVQKNKSKANKPTYFNQLADFGRVPRTGGYSGGGYGAYKWMRQSGP